MSKIKEIADIYLLAKKEKLTERKAFLLVKSLLSEVYEQDGVDVFVETLSAVTDVCCLRDKDAEVFGKGFFDIVAGGGDSLGDESAIYFENLANKFPNSAKIAGMLGDVYGIIVNETQDESYAEKLEALTKNNPALVNVALQQAYALRDTHFKEKDCNNYARSIVKIKNLYEAHPNIDFAKVYAQGLNKLVYLQEEDEAVQSITLIETLLTQWKDGFIASSYLDSLSKLTWVQDEKGCAAVIAKMESLWENWEYSKKTLAMHLAYTLANYSLCVDGKEKKKVLQRIAEMATLWEPAKKMAVELTDKTSYTYKYTHKPKKAK